LSQADRLEVQGNIFVEQAGFDDGVEDPFLLVASDSKDNVKSVAAHRGYGGIVIASVPFVEGCGGVPGSILQVCSCTGTPVSAP
jgi:hypothetical protein